MNWEIGIATQEVVTLFTAIPALIVNLVSSWIWALIIETHSWESRPWSLQYWVILEFMHKQILRITWLGYTSKRLRPSLLKPCWGHIVGEYPLLDGTSRYICHSGLWQRWGRGRVSWRCNLCSASSITSSSQYKALPTWHGRADTKFACFIGCGTKYTVSDAKGFADKIWVVKHFHWGIEGVQVDMHNNLREIAFQFEVFDLEAFRITVKDVSLCNIQSCPPRLRALLLVNETHRSACTRRPSYE